MGVSRRSHVAVAVAVLAVLALAIPVLARPDRVEISLSRTCQVGGSVLPAGTYQVVLDLNKVSFRTAGKTVAEARGEWKEAGQKIDDTSVRYEDNGRITAIRVQGRTSYFAIQ